MSSALQQIAKIKRLRKLKEEMLSMHQEALAVPTEPPIAFDDLLVYSGKLFLQQVTRDGVDKRGHPLRLTRWYREYVEFIGDFRIKEHYTMGCRQVGKSLAHYLLACVCNTEYLVDIIWTYDRLYNQTTQVQSNFQPLRRQWLRRKGIQPLKQDSNNTVLVQFRQQAEIKFASVSTSNDNGDGLAAVGAILTGTTSDIAMKDERSQAPLHCWEPVDDRLEQSRIETRPVYNIGTPGCGAGIEADVDRCQYKFVPHLDCPHCGERASLHPERCLLRPIDPNAKELVYTSKTGRPQQWFCHDPNDREQTAYFACEHCHGELSSKDREEAYFVCTATGVTLREFLDGLPKAAPERPIRAAINLFCSLLRGKGKAAEIISAGVSASFPANWMQQGIGLPSQLGSGGIPLALIAACYNREIDIQQAERSVVIGGGDQGNSDFWLWVMRVYLPKGYLNLPIEQVIERCHRELLFADGVSIEELDSLITTYGIEYGFVDNEPNRADMARRCKENCFEIADQRPQNQQHKQEISREFVEANKIQIPCFKLNTRLFCNHTRNAFLLGRYTLPDWSRLPIKSERSPVRHLMSPRIDPETGWWKRTDKIDDLFFAAMFAEAALYEYLSEFWGLSPNSIESSASFLYEPSPYTYDVSEHQVYR